MGQQIQVDPAALAQPANRFKAGAGSLTQMAQVVRTILQDAGQAAQHPVVIDATTTFGQATAAVLGAFGEDCKLMSDKLAAAGFVYHVADETAMVVMFESMGMQPQPPQGQQ